MKSPTHGGSKELKFWETEEAVKHNKRRDVSKIGIARARHASMTGRMYIPPTMAKPGDRIRFVETHEGMAFKIGEKGEYTVRIQNGGTDILITVLPASMNKYAPAKTESVEVEDFKGGYLIRYSQFGETK
jgi:hypothetical protein